MNELIYVMYNKSAFKTQTADIVSLVHLVSYDGNVLTFKLRNTAMYFTATVTAITQSPHGQHTYLIHDVYQLPQEFYANI
jgi:hypothetical protein